MVSFSTIDITIIILFFCSVVAIGFYFSDKKNTTESYLLSDRKVGLGLFVLTSVSTWYGGILGVGEFTYQYGVLSWLTQGLPYYIFAIVFAFLFAKKIRESSLFTIPDKLEKSYGRTVGIAASILIFILVSPAPYLLMMGSLISLVFDISLFWSLVIALVLSGLYLFKGGYRADIYTDAFEFFLMFIGFIVIVWAAVDNFGSLEFLEQNLPATHLNPLNSVSPSYMLVWFLIAMWTFTDPGFHQRCYSAKSGSIAKKGIIISIACWAVFDFLTMSTGLFARAALPNLENPILSFPLLAEKILTPGLKGIFYVGLFATILSTLNSFLFLSSTTFGKDLVGKIFINKTKTKSTNYYTRVGLIFTSVLAIIISMYFKSVINIWYTIGSICIPGVIVLVFGAYYPKFKVSNIFAIVEIVGSTVISFIWFMIRESVVSKFEELSVIEPMIIGLLFAITVQIIGIWKLKQYKSKELLN